MLRTARREDAAAVAALVALAHTAAMGAASPELAAPMPSAWVHDLMERPHPTMAVEHVIVVEDSRSGAIVSTLNAIPQVWTYAGIPFGVARVECVATHPDYWRKGLVRHQFEALHHASTERGDLAQVITGIPYFYRQFGYEYALALGGGRATPRSQVAALSPAAVEPFRVRLAREDDLPALMAIEQTAMARSLVACRRDEAAWRYELSGRTPGSMVHDIVLAVEAAGRITGLALLGSAGIPGLRPTRPVVQVSHFELAPGVSWLAVTRSLLRYLTGRASKSDLPSEHQGYEEVVLRLGDEHPAYAALGPLPRRLRSSAWYVRVPDLHRFVRHLAPALEARLVGSPAAGETSELLVSFYRSGLRLLVDGSRVAVESWPQANMYTAHASFPGLSFVQLALGYRDLTEIEHALPDCRVRDEARLLLGVLFPKVPSSVWPIA